MRVALYARVSLRGRQETENQLRVLREHCEKHSYTIAGEYVDEASGKTSNRDQFQRLFDDAHHKRFDMVLFWSLDRFSREGALKTLTYLEKLTSFGVAWRSHCEMYLDSAGIFRDAIVSIVATLAKQERIRISERTILGLQTARSKGKVLGRPRKIFDRVRLRELRSAGWSLGRLAKEFKLSRTHISRLVRDVPTVSTVRAHTE